jgi:predicted RNA binding protein YcfA (HicA-like mRNA interferase family)
MAAARLPSVSGARVVRALIRAGFIVDRIVGSHHVLQHPLDSRRTVTVPCHSNRDLKRGTLRAIIRQAGFTVEEFNELLRS